MRQTLYQLAYRNIQKYKRQYLFIFIVTLLLSSFFMSFITVWSNQYEVEKLYNQENYGNWYINFSAKISEKEKLENCFKQTSSVQYGYIYIQGYLDQYLIGSVDESLYDLCQLRLTQGNYPQKDNEIMVSDYYFENEKASIGDTVNLTIMNQEEHEYKIVGVIHNSQDSYFPQIYTELKQGDYLEVFCNQEVNMDNVSVWDKKVNPLGYSANSQIESYAVNIELILVLSEGLVLTIFVLWALASSSLKRRSQEFALLRGIGMTNRQLMLMVIYEMTSIVMIGITLGIILSFGFSYLYMLFLEKQLGYFVYHLNGLLLFNSFLILLSCLILSMIYPVFHSSKIALSGAFEGQNFQYIQIRYRRLKYQKRWRLALREMKANKRLAIVLFILFGMLSIYYAGIFIDPNNQYSKNNSRNQFDSLYYITIRGPDLEEEMVDVLKSSRLPHGTLYYSHYLDETLVTWEMTAGHTSFMADLQIEGDILRLDNKEWIKNSNIEGKLPKNKNEILINDTNIDFTTFQGFGGSNGKPIENTRVGDRMVLNDTTYTVVGVVHPNETIKNNEIYDLYYMPESLFYVLPETFNEIGDSNKSHNEYRLYCQPKEGIYYKQVLRYLGIKAGYEFNIHDKNVGVQSRYSLSDSNDILEMESLLDHINPYLLIIPFIVGLIFCYFLNKNHIMNHVNNYRLYHLIGMTKKELLRKEIDKALILSLYILLFECFWIVAFYAYYQIFNSIPIKEFLLSVVIIVFVNVFIYCVPFYRLLKKDTLKILEIKE